MWGKRAQAIIWFVSYIPVLLVATYRYFFEDLIEGLMLWEFYISEDLVHLSSIILIVIFSISLYYFFPKLIFKNIEKKIDDKNKGNEIYVKKFEKPNLNDYTFFLLTLILPLITVDFKSVVSLAICITVIFLIIILLTKIDYIIACPLFFVSKYKAFNVSFVYISDTEEKYVSNGYVITKHNDLYNNEFKIVKLIRNVYYLR